jgi:hypothetical protein
MNNTLCGGAGRVRKLLDRRNSAVFTDFVCEDVGDLCLAGNRGPRIQGWIMPFGSAEPLLAVASTGSPGGSGLAIKHLID